MVYVVPRNKRLVVPPSLSVLLSAVVHWLWMFLFLVMIILLVVMVDAKCTVKDRHGGDLMSLQVLPDGVLYRDTFDALECQTPNACEGWIIMGCTTVTCGNQSACRKAHLIDNRAVTCAADSACQEAHVFQGHDVWCGDQHSYRSCLKAIIASDATIMCIGAGACVAERYLDRLSVSVGTQGHLRCSSHYHDTSTTYDHHTIQQQQQQVSCRNVVVEVQHGHRACITDSSYDPRGCAVICVNEVSCDKESIHFIVK